MARISDWIRQPANAVGIALIAVFALFYFGTIGDYGITWDEHANFLQGNDTINYLKTGEYAGVYVSEAKGDATHGAWFFTISDLFAKTFSSLPVDVSHHIPLGIISIGLLAIVYFFTLKQFGMLEAISATLALGLFPQFIAHSHNNLKDPIMAFMYAATILAFYSAYTKRTWKSFIFAGILIGISFATKVVSFFIPVILIIWMGWLFLSRKKLGEFYFPLAKLIGMSIIGLITFFTFIPYLWRDFWEHLKVVLFWHAKDLNFVVPYAGQGYTMQTLPWHYTIVFLLVVTPMPFVIAGGIGLLKTIIHSLFGKNTFYKLLLIWFFVPWGKYAIAAILGKPFLIYDGMRHYLEVLVPVAILVGIGIRSIYTFASKRVQMKQVVACGIILAIIFVPVAIVDYQSHPYQVAFFNSFLGGTKGVQDSKWTRLVYWAEPLKESFTWINKNAPQNSTVRVDAIHIANYYARKDLNLAPMESEGGDYIITYYDAGYPAVYKRDVLGGRVLSIYDIRKK